MEDIELVDGIQGAYDAAIRIWMVRKGDFVGFGKTLQQAVFCLRMSILSQNPYYGEA